MKNIYDHICQLQIGSTINFNAIQANFPSKIPYGHVFTATLISGCCAIAEIFKYNPHNFISEDMEYVLNRLLNRAELVDGQLSSVECTEGTLTYLLESEYDKDGERNYRKKLNNGVTVSSNGLQATIPGKAIRYKTTPKEGWKYLDESVIIYITAISEWQDPTTDAQNAKIISEWLDNVSKHIPKAMEYLNALDALIKQKNSK